MVIAIFHIKIITIFTPCKQIALGVKWKRMKEMRMRWFCSLWMSGKSFSEWKWSIKRYQISSYRYQYYNWNAGIFVAAHWSLKNPCLLFFDVKREKKKVLIEIREFIASNLPQKISSMDHKNQCFYHKNPPKSLYKFWMQNREQKRESKTRWDCFSIVKIIPKGSIYNENPFSILFLLLLPVSFSVFLCEILKFGEWIIFEQKKTHNKIILKMFFFSPL